MLCIDCEHKRVSIDGMRFIQAAAMINQSLDDMDAAFGFPSSGGRIPINAIATAMRGKTTLNNIAVTHSTVGAINTGDLARIDAVITLSQGTDTEDVGKLVRQMTQIVIDTKELVPAAKKEILDIIETLGEQIVASHGRSKFSVVKALLESLEKKVSGVTALVDIVRKLATSIGSIFGI